MPKKVIISACILGELCRYDGKTKKIDAILEKYKEYEIIPFCPEAPLFGTPRERISVVEKDDALKIITDETQRDVTTLLEEEIQKFCQEHKEVDAIVLKSKSPSCGYETTPILNANKEIIKTGSGIAARMMQSAYPEIQIEDELNTLSLEKK